MKNIIYLVVGLLLVGCGQAPVDADENTTIFDFSDLSVQEIYKLQDQRDGKGLIPFLKDKNPTYRYIATMAFASIKDTSEATLTSTISALGDALQNFNEDENIRAMAAYALGQIGSTDAVQTLLNAFEGDRSKASFLVNGHIMEAIGKCAPEKYLRFLSTAPDYTHEDTVSNKGLAYGIYRYLVRGMSIPQGTKRMLSVLADEKMPNSVKRIAANYFGRSKSVVFQTSEELQQFIQIAQNEKDAYTRMALALALGKIENNLMVLTALQDMYRSETDYRAKINILRSIKKYDYVDAKPIYLGALKDKNESVVIEAAEYFFKNGIRPDVDLYYGLAKDSTTTNWQLKANMMGAALTNISYTRAKFRNEISDEMKVNIQLTKNPYEKGVLLECLAGFAMNYAFLEKQAFNMNNHAFARTKAIEALGNIRKTPKLSFIFGSDYGFILKFFETTFKKTFETGDVALMGTVAGLLREPSLGYRYTFSDDYRFLINAKSKLKLPKEIETYQEIQRTIDYFAGKEDEQTEPEKKYNHPIQWENLQALTLESKAIIETTKGNITFSLYPVEAPGSVSNFVELAKKGFYDGKAFHRVVPNFVVQGGCPRGDGWGSLDYTIRSELSQLKYDDEGWVGMASAGNDTEGTQWFITHSPAPHLDGRYTIFAKVTDGMKVAHRLTIGDKIKKITIE